MERKGIRDIMDKQRYRPTHLQKALIEKDIVGNWDGKSGLQNVYNLANGKVVPRDTDVFFFLSEFLDVSLREVLERYTVKFNQKKKINW